MFLRCIALIVCVTAIAGLVLVIRQQRVQTLNEMAILHRQAVRTRYEIWGLQGKVAGQMHPQRLRDSIARAHLELEPALAELAPPAEEQRPMLASAEPTFDLRR